MEAYLAAMENVDFGRRRTQQYLSTEEPQLASVATVYDQGIAASLYRAILDLFKVALEITKSRSTSYADVLAGSKAKHYPSLRNNFLRLSIWGQELGIIDGELDEQILYAEDVRSVLLATLVHLCEALYIGFLDGAGCFGANKSASLSTERALEITRFVISDDYAAVGPVDCEEAIKELTVAIDALDDLGECLIDPAVDFPGQLEIPRAVSDNFIAGPHLVYEDGLRQRFPKAEPSTITQHAIASYHRFTTLQQWRNKGEDPDESYVGQIVQPEVDEESRNNKQIRVQPSLTQRTFHDSGLGTSHRHESSYAKSLIGLNQQTTEEFRELIPELSMDQLLEGNVNCYICLRVVRISSNDEWILHVIGELMPYICIFTDCAVSAKPFEDKATWLDHIQAEHRIEMAEGNAKCNLCQEALDADIKTRIAHVEKHLIVIAKSVMPSDEDADYEDSPREDVHLPVGAGHDHVKSLTAPWSGYAVEPLVFDTFDDLDCAGPSQHGVSNEVTTAPTSHSYPIEEGLRTLFLGPPSPRPLSYAQVVAGLPSSHEPFRFTKSAHIDAVDQDCQSNPSILSNASDPDSLLANASDQASEIPRVLRCVIPVCGKEFTGRFRRGALSRHIRLIHSIDHPAERVYPCEYCDHLPFRQQDARLRHHRTKHPELGIKPAARRSK